MQFEKWQACGNDFILTEEEIPPAQAPKLCDRHFGIGADGILQILPSTQGDCKMVVMNADGSIAEMCGNGIRCVGGYMSAKTGKSSLKIETGAGLKDVQITDEISVNMGTAHLIWHHPLELQTHNAKPLIYENANHIDMGNPHCVLIVSEEETKSGAVERYGRLIERNHNLFAQGTNVEFVIPQGGNRLKVKVWERGVGRTLACGTGACASAYAAHLQNLVGNKVQVALDGGTVEVTINNNEITLKGPSSLTYRGELP